MFSGGKQFKVGYFGRQRPAASCPGKTSYKYDWLGRRVRKIVYGSPDVVTRYCYDGDQVIAHYNETGVLQRRFVYGVGIDEPVVMFVPGSGWYYYHYDGLGSVVALSDSSGEIVEQCSYDIFGEPSCVSGVGNPYKFTGREYDAETGLYYYRERYYSPESGRFLQPDPIGYEEGLNLYTYCGNDPINWTDPSGLFIAPIFIMPPGFEQNFSSGNETYDNGPNESEKKPEQELQKAKHGPQGTGKLTGQKKDRHEKQQGQGKGKSLKERIRDAEKRAARAVKRAAARAKAKAEEALKKAAESPATPYVIAGGLIIGDIILGGPTGEGIGPALVILGSQ